MEKGEIILYQPDNSVELEVRIEAQENIDFFVRTSLPPIKGVFLMGKSLMRMFSPGEETFRFFEDGDSSRNHPKCDMTVFIGLHITKESL